MKDFINPVTFYETMVIIVKNLKNNYMAISDQLLSKDPNAQLFK